jgi:predicted site-specific integrase-resolvase
VTDTHLTIGKASQRVKRSVRTIERWIEAGDLEVIEVRNYSGRVVQRYVVEEQLLAVLRKYLTAPKGGKGKPRKRRA